MLAIVEVGEGCCNNDDSEAVYSLYTDEKKARGALKELRKIPGMKFKIMKMPMNLKPVVVERFQVCITPEKGVPYKEQRAIALEGTLNETKFKSNTLIRNLVSGIWGFTTTGGDIASGWHESVKLALVEAHRRRGIAVKYMYKAGFEFRELEFKQGDGKLSWFIVKKGSGLTNYIHPTLALEKLVNIRKWGS